MLPTWRPSLHSGRCCYARRSSQWRASLARRTSMRTRTEYAHTHARLARQSLSTSTKRTRGNVLVSQDVIASKFIAHDGKMTVIEALRGRRQFARWRPRPPSTCAVYASAGRTAFNVPPPPPTEPVNYASLLLASGARAHLDAYLCVGSRKLALVRHRRRCRFWRRRQRRQRQRRERLHCGAGPPRERRRRVRSLRVTDGGGGAGGHGERFAALGPLATRPHDGGGSWSARRAKAAEASFRRPHDDRLQ